MLTGIFDDCKINVLRADPVHGGDINECYCLQTPTIKYFLKVNQAARYPGMFEKEARGLKALSKLNGWIVPEVLRYGKIDDLQYLLLEWLDKGQLDETSHADFGKALATLHFQTSKNFGWEEENFIGSIVQQNAPRKNWKDFYRENRILPLVKQMHFEGKFNTTDVKLAEKFCAQLDQLLPQQAPALLHGDLWSGNFMGVSIGKIAVFDPAVYYGHREMDIAMSHLFGGFDSKFYTAYNEINPLEPGWDKRLEVSQLYPLLVHALLFGGHYIETCRMILKKYAG